MVRTLVFVATLLVVAVSTIALPSSAGDLSQAVQIAAGANAAWLEGPGAKFPADIELGGTASASLSPHISGFGDLYYGFSHSYLRYDAGFKVTATDVDDPNFSAYLCAKYRGGSISAFDPDEWAFGAGFGYVPAPDRYPRLVLGGEYAYGAKTARSVAYLAVRYTIPLK